MMQTHGFCIVKIEQCWMPLLHSQSWLLSIIECKRYCKVIMVTSILIAVHNKGVTGNYIGNHDFKHWALWLSLVLSISILCSVQPLPPSRHTALPLSSHSESHTYSGRSSQNLSVDISDTFCGVWNFKCAVRMELFILICIAYLCHIY